MSNSNSRPVYSSAQGRLCPGCGQPLATCSCKKTATPIGDGKVRVRCERKGHGGKTVTVITGLPLDAAALTTLAGELKRRCGCGGTVKAGEIEIQGDHAVLMLSELLKRGFAAKRSGG
jgi:translation initiation factor 1